MSVRGVSLQAIRNVNDAARLEGEWINLWERCGNATVFQRPEWVLASWRWLSTGTPRLLVTVRAEDELVAVVPMRHASNHELEFEGTEVSDYLDALVDRTWEAQTVPALFEYLASLDLELRFDRLEETSALIAMLPAGGLWTHRIDERDVCPFVPLPHHAEHLSSVLPVGFYRRLQQSRRLVSRRFRTEVRAATIETVAQMLDRLVALHTSRWRARGQPGAFADRRVLEFYRESIPNLLKRGLVWLLELWLNGNLAAATLSFHTHHRALFYISGFAQQYEKVSPGRLLLAEVFERALAADCLELDFLRGVEPYKYDWGARNRSTKRLFLEPAVPSDSHCTAGAEDCGLGRPH